MAKRIIAALLLALSCGVAGPAPAGDPVAPTNALPPSSRTYTLGIIPFYGPEKIWQLYAPFVDHLNRTTGQTWELKLYHNHEAIIQDLCSGSLSVALFGPVPLGRAMKQCGVEPLVVALGPDGKPLYRSVMLTAKPSIKKLRDLRGKQVAFFRGSTAAHIFPAKMLKDAGVPLAEVQAEFYESQLSIINAVITRKVDAAGVKEALAKRFLQDRRLRVLKRSEPLPNFAFCGTPKLDPAVKNNFSKRLLALSPRKRPKDRKLMQEWDDEIRNGFIAPTLSYREAVERVNRVYEEVSHEIR